MNFMGVMTMMSTMMSISYAKHLEPVGCLTDKYVGEIIRSEPDAFVYFVMFDDVAEKDDTNLCLFECETVGAPYVMYTTGNKCICIEFIGDLGKIPCKEDESIIFGIYDEIPNWKEFAR